MSWALGFLIFALFACVVGLNLVEGVSAEIAWVVFCVFLVLMVIAAVRRALRGNDSY
jgi:uncharacterized membrane protein YtjA (UPF0391 family)